MKFSILQPAKEYPPCRPTSQFNPSEVGFSRRFLACALDIAVVSVPFPVIVAIVCATTGVRIQRCGGITFTGRENVRRGPDGSLRRPAATSPDCTACVCAHWQRPCGVGDMLMATDLDERPARYLPRVEKYFKSGGRCPFFVGIR
jgi:hypothetical protein